ncbi:hypothetical protein L7F22_049211 [Adiantum nelumboides]|nr:hypothetical protein [Adiantum nelumboides]
MQARQDWGIGMLELQPHKGAKKGMAIYIDLRDGKHESLDLETLVDEFSSSSYSTSEEQLAVTNESDSSQVKIMGVVLNNPTLVNSTNVSQDRTNPFVTADDNILTYNKLEYNLDNIRSGTNLLFLWKQIGNMYKKAVHLLQDQLKTHPRTKEDGFWHMLIYPYQMWLDGLFMAEFFDAQDVLLFKETGHFDDIALQLTLMEKHARDAKTGLLHHGYDEPRQQA